MPAAVQNALAQINGVTGVEVKLDKNWAEVYCDKEAVPADSDLTAAVEALGYTVTGID